MQENKVTPLSTQTSFFHANLPPYNQDRTFDFPISINSSRTPKVFYIFTAARKLLKNDILYVK
ncbi:hypothetical protein HMPREF0972_01314 [Actinomyces sp. oral taxon 848 str. F0332]|nr:hypothetical protein HMPREF0972_01314 [Actinomyces sp. oral taxon 848 str. F0332]